MSGKSRIAKERARGGIEMKYVGKAYDIDDITYILKEYSEKIPEKVISDIYFKLLDYVPTDKELGFISTEVSK